MRHLALLALLVLLALLPTAILAWEKEDFEIFDLHDSIIKIKGEKDDKGVKTDFYTILEVPPSASTSEITKSYRRLSLANHPDKNPDPDAATLYALLTSINAILKDPESRERYDNHRARGIPRWRGTGYFLARYKPGVAFITTFIIGLISVAQYVTSWIMYQQSKPSQPTGGESEALTHLQIRKRIKRAGLTETPEVKKAIKNVVPLPDLVKLVNAEMGLDVTRPEKVPAAETETVALSQPRVLDTLVFQIPIFVVNRTLGLFGIRKAGKSDDDGVFVPDNGLGTYEDEDVDEGHGATPSGSNGAGATKGEKAMKPSERLRLERLNRNKKPKTEEEGGNDDKSDGEKRPAKKGLGKGMIRSSTGQVLTKKEFIKKRQEEIAAAAASASKD